MAKEKAEFNDFVRKFILGHSGRLDYIDRYSSIPVTMKETVMSHIGWVTFYSLAIHNEVEGPEECTALILSHAVTHDLAECLTGDIVAPFKHSSKEFASQVQEAENQMVSKFLDISSSNLLNKVKEELNSIEHHKKEYVEFLVKTADDLSLFRFMWRELRRGNKEIKYFAELALKRFHSMYSNKSHSVIPNIYWKEIALMRDIYGQMHSQLCEEYTR